MGFQLIDPSQVVQGLYDAFYIVPKLSDASVAIITKPTTMLMSLMTMIPTQRLFGLAATFARCAYRRGFVFLSDLGVLPHLL
jgi:hypothetical protein